MVVDLRPKKYFECVDLCYKFVADLNFLEYKYCQFLPAS